MANDDRGSVDRDGDEDRDDFLYLLRGLVREPSVVGAEDAFFRVLRRELEELPIEVTRYQGVLVARGRDGDGEVFSAHIDRHGLFLYWAERVPIRSVHHGEPW